jgi:hypothetical protein
MLTFNLYPNEKKPSKAWLRKSADMQGGAGQPYNKNRAGVVLPPGFRLGVSGSG